MNFNHLRHVSFIDELKKIAQIGNIKIPVKKLVYSENVDTKKEDVEPIKAEASNWESESYATP